jgi:hypothetical protein
LSRGGRAARCLFSPDEIGARARRHSRGGGGGTTSARYVVISLMLAMTFSA